MVPNSARIGLRCPASTTSTTGHREVTEERSPSPPTKQCTQDGRMEVVRRGFERQEFSSSLVNLLLSNNRPNTRVVYASAWDCWRGWCVRRSVDPLSTPLKFILEYLAGVTGEREVVQHNQWAHIDAVLHPTDNRRRTYGFSPFCWTTFDQLLQHKPATT